MKVELKPTKKPIQPVSYKQLHITIYFQDRFKLRNILQAIVRSVHLGQQKYSGEIDDNYFEYDMEYFKKTNYQEKHINGNVCHTYRSKI